MCTIIRIPTWHAGAIISESVSLATGARLQTTPNRIESNGIAGVCRPFSVSRMSKLDTDAGIGIIGSFCCRFRPVDGFETSGCLRQEGIESVFSSNFPLLAADDGVANSYLCLAASICGSSSGNLKNSVFLLSRVVALLVYECAQVLEELSDSFSKIFVRLGFTSGTASFPQFPCAVTVWSCKDYRRVPDTLGQRAS